MKDNYAVAGKGHQLKECLWSYPPASTRPCTPLYYAQHFLTNHIIFYFHICPLSGVNYNLKQRLSLAKCAGALAT